MEKKVIKLTQEEIDIIHNAIAVFNNEISAAYLGCNSWYGDKMREKHPDMHPFDLCDLMLEQAEAARAILERIEAD